MIRVGWARNETDALRARLLLWNSDELRGGQMPGLSSFAEAEQVREIDEDRMGAIVSALEASGLVILHRSFGGIMAASVTLTAEGKDCVQVMRPAACTRPRIVMNQVDVQQVARPAEFPFR